AGYDRRLRIRRARPKAFSKTGVHVKGIESFWSFTKRRLAKFNGVSVNFERHLKEGEGRSAKEPDTLAQELKSLLGESLLNR
ncbi:MAG: IS1595 family transposase, partial [Gemmobacter sp.]|nr:IS1595 family transposase [Gemmobacter sp.]